MTETQRRSKNLEQQLYLQETPQESTAPNPLEYPARQILYSYWWCFLHVCLRCVRRVRLTPATTDEFGFHPDQMAASDQIDGGMCRILWF